MKRGGIKKEVLWSIRVFWFLFPRVVFFWFFSGGFSGFSGPMHLGQSQGKVEGSL